MSTIEPAFSSTPSSASSFTEPKENNSEDPYDVLSYNKELESEPPTPPVDDIHFNPATPRWARFLIGDAAEGYETKRALGSRHIMMIGTCICTFTLAYSNFSFMKLT